MSVSLPLVLDVVVKASIILTLAALAAAALRRSSASARHLVWTLGLAGALAVPVLSAAVPRWELPIVAIDADATPLPVQSAAAPAPAVERSAPALGHHASLATPPAPDSVRSWSIASLTWPALVLLVWGAGAAIVLGRLLLGLIAVRWMSSRMPEVVDGPWIAQARALTADLGLTRVRFLRSPAASMPMAWGVARSTVLMPVDADTWSPERLRVVLLHELAHVKRRDCLTHLVAQLACAAYWFNPLTWMAARRLRAERERACDDLVLAAGTRGSDYADQLLEIARVMRGGRFPALMAGASLAMAHRSQLEGRLMAILDPSVPRRGLSRAGAAVAATTCALLVVPVAAVQPWVEARAAVKATAAEMTQAAQQTQTSQPAAPPAGKPIEAYPGQADADVRANAAAQPVIQDRVQGQLQSHIQSGVQAGVASGVAGSVSASVASGIADTVGSTIGAIAGGLSSAVVEGVTEGLREQDSEQRANPAHTARDPRTVNALIEALKDTDKDVRDTALQALVQMREPRIFEPLVAALRDADADVREHAAFGLGQLRDARAVEPLGAAIKDVNASVREQVVFALGQLRAVSAVEPLSTALHDASNDVREQAAFALGQIRDRRAVEPLISALKDEKPNVREQAAFALGQLRDAKAVEALVIALKDANADVREQAAFALGQIRDARAIDGLTAALKDANAQVRQQAAFALGQIR